MLSQSIFFRVNLHLFIWRHIFLSSFYIITVYKKCYLALFCSTSVLFFFASFLFLILAYYFSIQKNIFEVESYFWLKSFEKKPIQTTLTYQIKYQFLFATSLEHVNKQIFKVNFKNLIFFSMVLTCVKVGEFLFLNWMYCLGIQFQRLLPGTRTRLLTSE